LFAFIPLYSMSATGLVQQQDMLQQVQHILIRYVFLQFNYLKIYCNAGNDLHKASKY